MERGQRVIHLPQISRLTCAGICNGCYDSENPGVADRAGVVGRGLIEAGRHERNLAGARHKSDLKDSLSSTSPAGYSHKYA